jgi:hypothetical protein
LGATFDLIGILELSSSKRSIRFLFKNPGSLSDDYFYVSLKDLQDVLEGRKKTATLWKPKEAQTIEARK